MDQLLKKLKNKENLSFHESKVAFEILMNGKASDDEIFNFLTLLSDKGEVSDEIAGGEFVLRNKSKRVSIKNTRAMITSILNGSIDNAQFEKENYFGLMIPINVNDVDKEILNPINAWTNKSQYDIDAKNLANLFRENFKSYGKEVKYLLNSGPII